jgi:hypothetical protein
VQQNLHRNTEDLKNPSNLKAKSFQKEPKQYKWQKILKIPNMMTEREAAIVSQFARCIFIADETLT